MKEPPGSDPPPTSPSDPDRDAILSIANGTDADIHLRSFLATWSRRLHARAKSKQIPFADAQDLVQNWSVKVWQGAKTFNPSWPSSPWLWKIFVNIESDYFRERHQPSAHSSTDAAMLESLPGSSCPGISLLEIEERNEYVRRLLQTLNTSERLILFAYVTFGEQRHWPNGLADRIHQETNIHPNHFNTNYRRTRAKLKKLIAQQDRVGSPA